MGNDFGITSVTGSMTLETKSVTNDIANCRCIICSKAFEVPRVGKLYCSNRCKQFGYYHKAEINQALDSRKRVSNAKPMTFFIDDYTKFDRKQKSLKRFRELLKKKLQWESIEQEFNFRQDLALPISNYLLDSYVSKKLTEHEEDELFRCETELDESLIDLNAKGLSLEQWSFLKSLHTSLDEIPFFELACSLSNEFLSKLCLSPVVPDKINEFEVIKHKFINHCNLISMGIIKFEKREQLEEE